MCCLCMVWLFSGFFGLRGVGDFWGSMGGSDKYF